MIFDCLRETLNLSLISLEKHIFDKIHKMYYTYYCVLFALKFLKSDVKLRVILTVFIRQLD